MVTTGRFVYWLRMLMTSWAFHDAISLECGYSSLKHGVYRPLDIPNLTATSSRLGNWNMGEPNVVSITIISHWTGVAGSIVKVFSVHKSPVYRTEPSGCVYHELDAAQYVSAIVDGYLDIIKF